MIAPNEKNTHCAACDVSHCCEYTQLHEATRWRYQGWLKGDGGVVEGSSSQAFPFAERSYPSISPSVLKPILQISPHLRFYSCAEIALTKNKEEKEATR